MKDELIKILLELYRIYRFIGSKSSYGFYNAIIALNGISEYTFRTDAMILSEEVKYIGPHIQDIIDDMIIGEYNRLNKCRKYLKDIGKLDKTLYEINNDIISRRVDINIIKEYLYNIGVKSYDCKFGHGSIDPYRKRFGVGSVTIKNHDYNKLNKLLIHDYEMIFLSKNKVIYKRRNFTNFLIIINIK